MAKLQTLVVIFTVLVLQFPISYLRVQSRPGPLGLSPVEILLSSSPRQLLSADPLVSDPERVNISKKDAEDLHSEDKLDAVCRENGTCDEKRLLTASVDYMNDGPNPITDPPH